MKKGRRESQGRRVEGWWVRSEGYAGDRDGSREQREKDEWF